MGTSGASFRIRSCVDRVPLMLATLIALTLQVDYSFRTVTSSTTPFVISNSCGYTVWPGVLSSVGTQILENGGFALDPGQVLTVDAPAGWSGRLWGRTGCTFNSDGIGSCVTGDCDGKLQCNGVGAEPPATLAEFTLSSTTGGQDFYDVSLVDGYNVPMAVGPSTTAGSVDTNNTSTECGVASCAADINKVCPSSLQVLDNSANGVVSCKSACLAFGTAEYCCSGVYGNPNTCKPSSYSQIFKTACPTAYSYAYDDATSTFTCASATSYLITFCPEDTSTSSTQKISSTSDGGGGSTSSTSSSSSDTTSWNVAWMSPNIISSSMRLYSTPSRCPLYTICLLVISSCLALSHHTFF